MMFMLVLLITIVIGCKKDNVSDNGGGGNNSGYEAPDVLTFNVGNVSFDMIKVQGGTFWMGSQKNDPDGQNYNTTSQDNEVPVHQVMLSNYYIGKYEVTQELWKAVMGTNPSQNQGDLLPVESVGWNAIQDFMFTINNKLNDETHGMQFRLPTEAQWEYAAKGGNGSRGFQFSGSNQLNTVGWYKGNSEENTHRVGSKEPNELFLYDMSGNVMECCNDYYGAGYVGAAQINPIGPSQGEYTVLRGGCFSSENSNDYGSDCKVSSRSGWNRFGSPRIGFRLVLSNMEGQACISGVKGRIDSITKSSALLNGLIVNDGGSSVTETGFYYSTSSDPLVNGTQIILTECEDEFCATIENLQPSTMYYFCAYAKNDIGKGYSEVVEFKTLAEIITSEVTNITATSATVGGVIPDVGDNYTERGICINTSNNPTISDTHYSEGTGPGSFTKLIQGLYASTTYYVRAYAVLDTIINYGNVISFTTLPPQIPTVKTLGVSFYDYGSGIEITASGKIIDGGGAYIDYDKVGILISTSPNPTYNGGTYYYHDWIYWNGPTGVGYVFELTYGDFGYNTTYYFRAFAVNSVGVGYGEVIEKTSPNAPHATITTHPVTDIGSTSAVCGGTISTFGEVMASGICWSTHPDPERDIDYTIENYYPSNGSFSLTMTGLTPNTTYYVRAFGFGYIQGGYGENQVFTTLEDE